MILTYVFLALWTQRISLNNRNYCRSISCQSNSLRKKNASVIKQRLIYLQRLINFNLLSHWERFLIPSDMLIFLSCHFYYYNISMVINMSFTLLLWMLRWMLLKHLFLIMWLLRLSWHRQSLPSRICRNNPNLRSEHSPPGDPLVWNWVSNAPNSVTNRNPWGRNFLGHHLCTAMEHLQGPQKIHMALVGASQMPNPSQLITVGRPPEK